MSECVVRMEMPKACWSCGMRFVCKAANDFMTTKEAGCSALKVGMEGCLIVCQLPEGHGRLIDASTIIGEVDAGYTDDYGNPIPVNRPVSVDEYLGLEVPTIVPAEAERIET